MHKKILSEIDKFKQAVRFEIPFTSVNFELAQKETKSAKSNITMEITAQDFLCGLRKVSKLKGKEKKMLTLRI